jgi:hypothetical protein
MLFDSINFFDSNSSTRRVQKIMPQPTRLRFLIATRVPLQRFLPGIDRNADESTRYDRCLNAHDNMLRQRILAMSCYRTWRRRHKLRDELLMTDDEQTTRASK